MRPICIDWFPCEGGASRGYARAGFDVYGVDLWEDYTRARYPFPGWQGDALAAMDALIEGLPITFDDGRVIYAEDVALHAASPPCQRYSITNAARQADYPDLIGPVRDRLRTLGRPYILENVKGSPLIEPIELCGCMFGLTAVDTDGVTLHMHRVRLFESNVEISPPGPHNHEGHEWIAGAYGGARRDKYEAKYVRHGGYVPRDKAVVEDLMGLIGCTWKGLFQAIPPAYTEHLGRQVRKHPLCGESTDSAGAE